MYQTSDTYNFSKQHLMTNPLHYFMPFSQRTVNFIFTFPIQRLFLLFMITPSVTKSRYVLRKALTAVRIHKDKASSECLSNQFTFYPVLQRWKDQLLFGVVVVCLLKMLGSTGIVHVPTQSSGTPVLKSPCHWGGTLALEGNSGKQNQVSALSALLHNLVSSTFTSRQLWIFLHLSAPQEWVLLISVRRHPAL